ncbi:MAG: hypothetical protein ACR2OE_19265 [Thermomicrobiales bacterium]
MSKLPSSFGRIALEVASAREYLAAEALAGQDDQFAMIDTLVTDLLLRSLSGERIVTFERSRDSTKLSLLGLNMGQRQFVDERFSLVRQQESGAWFLPEEATVRAGWSNLPFHFDAYPRFATGIASEDRGKVLFHDTADSLFAWAVLEPLFERLFRPLELRGPLLGNKDRAWQLEAWQHTERDLFALGFDISDVLTPMRFGGGWSNLDAVDQERIRRSYLEALVLQASQFHGAGYRAHQIQRLLKRYYQQNKRQPPKLWQILTQEFQRVVAGFFGGNWLSLLAYAGEEPHPDERIATALPEPRLTVANDERISAVAAAQGLPVEEVKRILAAFWGTGSETSPIEERVSALREFWWEFDAIHARQLPGDRPLWGLVDEGTVLGSAQPYDSGMYRTLLPASLIDRIDHLWGTGMLRRWPNRIVSTIAPHKEMAETFGPALKFWHGCALTAWFVCEGSTSRTDLSGLADYYRTEIRVLEQLACPVDPSLFDELTHAEAWLGPPEPIPETSTHRDIASGVNLTLEFSVGSRRAGFEILRDIISRYRRRWASSFLEVYMNSCWETEIRDAARDFGLLHERKGRPPTAKQFATHAAAATNHWFGGDMSRLYSMIGEKSPIAPVLAGLMRE